MDGRVVGMYCTKEMHKWQGATYLNGKYEEHREKLDSRFKGKQMSTKPLKLGNMATAGVLFSFPPAPKVVDPYDVGNSYLKTHPLDTRKLGFGTRDAPKKGEFMSQQRAAQVRIIYTVFLELWILCLIRLRRVISFELLLVNLRNHRCFAV